jgi:hypothetical protein
VKRTAIWGTSIAFITIFTAAGAMVAAPNDDPLIKGARVTKRDAEKTALDQVPNGAIKSAELEREHGKLIWSFDIGQKGTRDIKEVQVDAKSGRIVSVATETPKDQAKEAAQDKKK